MRQSWYTDFSRLQYREMICIRSVRLSTRALILAIVRGVCHSASGPSIVRAIAGEPNIRWSSPDAHRRVKPSPTKVFNRVTVAPLQNIRGAIDDSRVVGKPEAIRLYGGISPVKSWEVNSALGIDPGRTGKPEDSEAFSRTSRLSVIRDLAITTCGKPRYLQPTPDYSLTPLSSEAKNQGSSLRIASARCSERLRPADCRGWASTQSQSTSNGENAPSCRRLPALQNLRSTGHARCGQGAWVLPVCPRQMPRR
jgi:hypothetical protein